MRALARLGSMRAHAESLMADTLTAYVPTAQTIDGLEVDVYTAQGTTPGKVQGTSVTGRDTVSRTVTIGGADLTVVEGGLQIPLSEFVGPDGLAIVASEQRGIAWEFAVTAIGPTTDPALLGRWFMVTNVPVKSAATARRMDVVVVPPPDPSQIA